MSQINFLGSASGLPLEELVSTLVKVERDSKLGRINKTKSTLEASLSGVGRLKSALSSFQTAVKALGGNNLNARVATITQPTENKTYLEASASNNAVPGSFDVKVNQLAAGSRFESADGAFASASDVVSTSDGILTFTADGKSFDVEVTAGMTLNQLRQKINASSDNFGVNVNLINAGGAVGTKLVVSSNVTGEGNDLQVTNNNAELDAISTVPTGGSPGLTAVQIAQDAEIEIDGIKATSSSNVFSNVIQDVTLTARAVTPDNNNAALSISTDKDAAEEKINAFITSYNELVDQINALTKHRTLGADGKTVTAQGGPLSGDPLPRTMMAQLRGILGSAFEGADDSLSTLYSMGITFNSDGKLEISSSTEFGGDSGRVRFNRALDENYDAIASLFGGDNGLSESLDKFITQFSQAGGIIASKENSLRLQIDKNAKDLEAANRYMQSYEQTLRSRYTALDGLLGSMQNMASTVTAQLANLPGFKTQTRNQN
ncbi:MULTISPECIES: flagellar filament capping protein FliD [Alkalimonas]|uniref:Flagellar hook-associated protein 2 n=2 Tax=Alkalimonas TaxID=265980 RepID=A0ABU7J3X3_9GAMM|nr:MULTISPECIES: flagellar filament capping protein FliD [unclassified Alkalimonas]MEE2001194.1 flagellar filament capping protein FliD [Alkalimonas sp. MEB108]MEE2025825.1 flagellar filament capping protein FliD [Alkalimonas sp. MEB004]